ncbi:carbohydrate ABC transporter permease [Microbacterium allomyrinae]|uniref:Sugar ABC transporter permease n=1 Tax=Microbacterium allomyrinae TaxID=2830666 RepID=A0A9X1LTK6_9MICO|nr:sugar ABC transporter permease [Microbacterium allomyrinae]MCC2031518.1 sugar ABC transporter permease [Microbacterium allomyrinae]
MTRRTALRDASAPYLMIAPFFVLFFVFGLFPVLATFWLSLWEWNPIGEQRWIGGANFVRMSADPRFWTAMRNTLGIFALATIPQIALALVLAHALNQARLRFAALLRVTLLVPYVTSAAAIAIVVAQVVDRDYGLLTRLVQSFGGDPVDVLSSTLGSWITVAAMVTWRWFGFTTLLFLTVLQSVPRDVFAAAEVDGAGALTQLRYISVPLLGPAILFTTVTSVVGTLQLFAEPLLVQPGSTTCGPARQCQTLALFIYELGFREFQSGYGAAVAVTVFLVTAVLVGGAAGLSSRVRRRS